MIAAPPLLHAGTSLRLEHLILVNPAVADPTRSPTFLNVSLARGASLALVDINILTTSANVAAYAQYFARSLLANGSISDAIIYTVSGRGCASRPGAAGGLSE